LTFDGWCPFATDEIVVAGFERRAWVNLAGFNRFFDEHCHNSVSFTEFVNWNYEQELPIGIEAKFNNAFQTMLHNRLILLHDNLILFSRKFYRKFCAFRFQLT
jgi:hypothetical protein